ncbi:MAG: hypothetical protein HZB16_18100 [Armatimonadetes bacterium]|nr:hypothetical protein [Armatimonadota bacterium]
MMAVPRTLVLLILVGWVGASALAQAGAEPPLAAWTFDGTTQGLEPLGLDTRAVEPRFAEAGTLPGRQGRPLALGVKPGDAEYLVGPAPRLGANYTIEAWIRPTELTTWNRLVLNWGDQGRFAYHLALHDGQVSLAHGLAGGRYVLCEGGDVAADQWQQVVGVAARNPDEPAKSTLRVFLNGQLVGTSPFDGSAGDGGTEPLVIGDSLSMASRDLRFRGYLGSVTLWARPLSDAEVAARYEPHRAELERLYCTDPPRIGEIVFAERQPGRDPSGHYYANFGYVCTNENEWLHGADGGRLAILNPATRGVRTLLTDDLGAVRDPQVHYDGQRVLFSYRRGGTHHYNLYEINVDGSGLRQLTTGDWDDVEPTYLPDGGIAFCSTRCRRYVPCWMAPVAVLFRCNADGTGLRQLSSGAVGENTPSVLPDGRILYTRWEYVNRDAVSFHHLWTMNPDGTRATNFFGNQLPGGVFIDARPVPESDDVLYVDAGYHGTNEHAGTLMRLDPRHGPNDPAAAQAVLGGRIRDPWPLSSSQTVAARDNSLILIDGRGQARTLYRGRMMVHEPRPLAPRPREHLIAPRIDQSKTTGTLFLSDIAIGRNMAGVRPGAIRRLLVMEDLAKPANYHGGGTTPIAHGGSWTLKRILGTVPVERDGSAFFEVPAGRSVYFAALDENDRSVKQMRSFVTLQPGETAGCIGCHESHDAAAPPTRGQRLAAGRPASVIQPIAGVPEVMDFPRDVQPILDRHCLRCHNPDRADGGLDLCGDRGPAYSLAYYNLILHRQLSDGAGLRWPGVPSIDGRPLGNDVPYTTYSSAAPLMAKIDGSHHLARLSALEQTTMRLWIDSSAVYAGTYAAYGTGQIGGWWRNNEPVREMDDAWPSTRAARDAMTRRCSPCHGNRLPVSVTAQIEIDGQGDLEGWQRPTSRFSRHTIFNLSRPEKSIALTATLARVAGGFAEGQAPAARPVPSDLSVHPRPVTHAVIFASRDDPDYVSILTHLQAAKARLDEIKRFDMPGFQPRYEYLREMKRDGVLPADFAIGTTLVDAYQLDQAYWRLFWPRPSGSAP